MTIKSRTIDNLGVEASVRYAKDKELLEPKFIEESKLISQKTQISAITPYIPREWELSFSMAKPLPFALFSPPPQYSTDFLFTYQLIPALGGYEVTDEEIDLKEMVERAFDQKKRKRKRKNIQDLEEQEKEEEEKEILITLFECIHKIDQSMNLINARRNQYQRG